MKRFCALMFLVLLCFSLIACQNSNQPSQSTTTSATEQPQSTTSDNDGVSPNLPNPKYQAYSIYLMDSTGGAANPPNYSRLTLSEIRVETGLANVSLKIGGLQVEGQYVETSYLLGVKASEDRLYRTDFGFIKIDSNTGRLSSVQFKTSRLADANKTDVLSQQECKTKAQEFLASIGYRDLSEYTLMESELYHGSVNNYYGFLYTKTIDGVATTDKISVNITEYGSVVYLKTGDDIDESAIANLSVDYARAERVARNYAQEVCDRYENVTQIDYQLGNPCFLRLEQGSYALGYSIQISYTSSSGGELETVLLTAIPLETR